MTSSIISTTYSEATSGTHSPLQTIFLHLLPGGAVFIFFVMLARLATQSSLPASIALLATWAAAGIPIELGIMFYHGWQQNGRLSLNGVVFNRERIPLRQYAWLVPLLLVWTATWSTILIPENETLRQTFFAWWPDWLILSEFARNLDQYPSPVLWMIVLLSAVMNLAVPMVEELYFRGFLLPRIPSGQQLAPLINAVLFSVYHFWLPWETPMRILALLPVVYAVQWKRNLYISVLVHVLLNMLGTIGLMVLVMGQGQ